MSQQRETGQETNDASGSGGKTTATTGDNDAATTRDTQDNELAAEQDSAAAMDMDVPHPPDDSQASDGETT
jgi:hypothetical protein